MCILSQKINFVKLISIIYKWSTYSRTFWCLVYSHICTISVVSRKLWPSLLLKDLRRSWGYCDKIYNFDEETIVSVVTGPSFGEHNYEKWGPHWQMSSKQSTILGSGHKMRNTGVRTLPIRLLSPDRQKKKNYHIIFKASAFLEFSSGNAIFKSKQNPVWNIPFFMQYPQNTACKIAGWSSCTIHFSWLICAELWHAEH